MIDGTQGDAFEGGAQPDAQQTNNEVVGKRRYFSSTEGPFQSASNIYLFYGGADRGLIINAITHRIRKYPEPVIVTGEVGSGKSMMSLVLGQKLNDKYNIIEFDHAVCTPDNLLRHLVIELTPELVTDSDFKTDLDGEGGAASALIDQNDRDAILVALIDKLRQGTPGNKPVLFLVDSKSVETEAYHLLLQMTQAINSHGRPFSCVVFAEEPVSNANTVDATEDTAATDQDKPAENVHFRLRRLNLAETTEYLQHHMLLFDFNKRDLFTREMAYFIADRSKGNCSTINTLARNAFLLAHLEGADRVSMGHLLVAGQPKKKEKPETFAAKHQRGVKLAAAFVVSSAVVTAILVGVLKLVG